MEIDKSVYDMVTHMRVHVCMCAHTHTHVLVQSQRLTAWRTFSLRSKKCKGTPYLTHYSSLLAKY